jgi:hypothetical protein
MTADGGLRRVVRLAVLLNLTYLVGETAVATAMNLNAAREVYVAVRAERTAVP